MADDLDPAVLERTNQTLGSLITKPKLTEKLLKKPPFRFLHDVVKGVMAETGAMQGLFNDDDMDSEALKQDKQKKIDFLQKTIDFVQACNGERLTIRPAKVVAGLEAVNTNVFLQGLHKAATQNIANSPNAVAQVTGGAPPQEAAAPPVDGFAAQRAEQEAKREQLRQQEEADARQRQQEQDARERWSRKNHQKLIENT